MMKCNGDAEYFHRAHLRSLSTLVSKCYGTGRFISKVLGLFLMRTLHMK